MAAFVSCGSTGSHFIYAAVPAANQLAVFREDPYSGVLTQLAESPYTVGFGPESVVIHPSGKFLYVANAGQNENDVSLFDINSDGTVTEVTPRTATGTLPFVMAMDPAGNYLYVANVASNNLSVYSINTASNSSTNPLGKLTPDRRLSLFDQPGREKYAGIAVGEVSLHQRPEPTDWASRSFQPERRGAQSGEFQPHSG